MNQIPLFDRLRDIVEGIDLCVQTHHYIPGLILLYSAIDQISWLASNDESESVRSRFRNWVNSWMLPAGKLKCNSIDLYAARCGMLHTLTSESDLSKSGKAKRLAYSYNYETVEAFQVYLDNAKPNELIAIRIEDLVDSFRQGLANFIEHTMTDRSLMVKLETKAMRYYSHIQGGELPDQSD